MNLILRKGFLQLRRLRLKASYRIGVEGKGCFIRLKVVFLNNVLKESKVAREVKQ